MRKAIVAYQPQVDLSVNFSTQWRTTGVRKVNHASAGAPRGSRNSARRTSPARGAPREKSVTRGCQGLVEIVANVRTSPKKTYAPPSPKPHKGPEGSGRGREGGRDTGKIRGSATDEDSLRQKVRVLLSRTEAQANVLAKQAISLGDHAVNMAEQTSRMEEQSIALNQMQTTMRSMEYILQALLSEKTAGLRSTEYVPSEKENPPLPAEDDEVLSLGHGESRPEREELLRDSWDA